MGLPPTSPTHLGAPNRTERQLDGQPGTNRGARTSGGTDGQVRPDANTDITGGSTRQIGAVDKTPPPPPFKLAMDNFGNKKSPLDAVRGRIPTQDQIKEFVEEYVPATPTPPTSAQRVFRFDDERAARKERAEAHATQGRNFQDDYDTLNALLGAKLLELDPKIGQKILEDHQLMEKLESFATYNKGTIVFTDKFEAGVYYGEGVVVVGTEHLTEEGMDLHKDLRVLFKLDDKPASVAAPPVTTNTAPTELTRPAKETVEALFEDYLGDEIELAALQDVMDDLPLMLKLDDFLTKTDGKGTIVFLDSAAQEVSWEYGRIGMAEYHFEPKSEDKNRPNIHQALRARFELPPLTQGDTATYIRSTEDDGSAIADGSDNKVASTEKDTVITTSGDETTRARTQSDIDLRLDPKQRYTTVKELWEKRVDENPGTGMPKP